MKASGIGGWRRRSMGGFSQCWTCIPRRTRKREMILIRASEVFDTGLGKTIVVSSAPSFCRLWMDPE